MVDAKRLGPEESIDPCRVSLCAGAEEVGRRGSRVVVGYGRVGASLERQWIGLDGDDDHDVINRAYST